MRSAPGAPIHVRAGAAVATVALTTAMLVFVWTNPWWWWHASAAVPGLSTWGFVAALQLLLAVIIILPTVRPTLSAVGLAPQQVFAAFGVGVAIWILSHVVALVDIAASGCAPPPDVDVLGDILGAYGEELIHRVVVLGAISTALRNRMTDSGALVAAIFGSALVFWASHLPRDVVTGEIADPARFAVVVSHGVLLAGVYLSSGNVMLATVVHALGNGPMLAIAGAHHVTVTPATNWICCIAMVLWYQRRLRHSVPAKHG